MKSGKYRGRIAPTPTGYLHLGHGKTFWTAYQRCKAANGTLIYRDEDIDPKRCKAEYSKAGIEDLTKLGITWQEGPFYQSERLLLYRKGLEHLIRTEKVYPCTCSRQDISQHPDTKTSSDGEYLFPSALRPTKENYNPPPILSVNWRFRVDDNRVVKFTDNNQGPRTFRVHQDFGDFLVWRKEGMPSYELAVVIDDADMKITEVVRGLDLLVSTARQWLLYEAFGWNPPEFYHAELVKDKSGERLAKRKNSVALRTLFAQGHTLETIESLWNAGS